MTGETIRSNVFVFIGKQRDHSRSVSWNGNNSGGDTVGSRSEFSSRRTSGTTAGKVGFFPKAKRMTEPIGFMGGGRWLAPDSSKEASTFEMATGVPRSWRSSNALPA
jgi:hypothetical protein